MARYSIEEIHDALDGIRAQLYSSLSRLEGELPDHISIGDVGDAAEELERQCDILRKWIDGFSLEQVTVTHHG